MPKGRPPAQSKRADQLPDVRPRPSRGKRTSDDDWDESWPTNEWDELSDVDYWAELASDKPLTTPTPSGRAPGSGDQRPADEFPSGSARQMVAAPDEADTALMRRRGDSGFRPRATGRRPENGRPREASRPREAGRPPEIRPPMETSRPPAPADDPLTSPSFPRVAAEDGRSYRRSRSASEPARRPAEPGYGGRPPGHRIPTPPGGYPVRNGADYARSSPATDPYQSVPRGASAPQGYPIPAAANSGPYPVPGNGYQAPAAGYDQASQPDYPSAPLAPVGYPADPGVGYAAPSSSPYSGPIGNQPFPVNGEAFGYPGYEGDPLGQYPAAQPHPATLPPVPAPQGSPPSGYMGNGYQATGHPGNGYPGNGYPGNGYSVPPPPSDQGAYYPAPYEQAGYPAAGHENGRYAAADPYAVDPYGYPGGGYGR